MLYLYMKGDGVAEEDGRNYSEKLMRLGFWREYGIRLQDLRIARGEMGKPFALDYPRIHFNISHCAGCAALIFGDVDVGVDVERIRAHRVAARRYLSGDELRFLSEHGYADEIFFKFWSLKESYGKAVGTGIFPGLKRLTFTLEGEGAHLVADTHAQFCIVPSQRNIVAVACRLTDRNSSATWSPHLVDVTEEMLKTVPL